MAVYVDDMHQTAMGNYGRMKMCHMLADTVPELHEMADKIGIKRKWYQGPPVTINPHYDICMSKRKEAVECGAKEITMREAVPIMSGMRKKAIEDYNKEKLHHEH